MRLIAVCSLFILCLLHTAHANADGLHCHDQEVSKLGSSATFFQSHDAGIGIDHGNWFIGAEVSGISLESAHFVNRPQDFPHIVFKYLRIHSGLSPPHKFA